MRSASGWRLTCALAVSCSVLLVQVAARSQTAAPESSSSTEAPTFKSRVNLVVVPVVVYDKKGQAIGDLKREDFQIFDDGKPQQITSFNLQTNESESGHAARNSVLGSAVKSHLLGTVPGHYFAYLFDDLHMKMGDLQQVRAAAKKHLERRTSPEDRAAVFTTSGHISLAFTDDKALLGTAMDRITPQSLGGGIVTRCPYMNYPLAIAIVNESGASIDMSCGTTCNGTPAWNGATEDLWSCLYQRQDHLQERARREALDAALREVRIGEANRNAALLAIRNTVRRLAAMPGTRTLVLVSPGFLTGENHLDQNEAISSALQSQIVINTLDARGLYTGVGNASDENGPSTPTVEQMEGPIIRAGMQLQNDVMAELAEGTGGKFFRDNNDLSGAFDQLASPPRFIYMLAFKPEILKENGRFHRLRCR